MNTFWLLPEKFTMQTKNGKYLLFEDSLSKIFRLNLIVELVSNAVKSFFLQIYYVVTKNGFFRVKKHKIPCFHRLYGICKLYSNFQLFQQHNESVYKNASRL